VKQGVAKLRIENPDDNLNSRRYAVIIHHRLLRVRCIISLRLRGGALAHLPKHERRRLIPRHV
jgi:hypothetical protein